MQQERFNDDDIGDWLGRRVRGAGQQGEVVGVCQYEHDQPEDGWLLLVAWWPLGKEAHAPIHYGAIDRAALARFTVFGDVVTRQGVAL